MTYAPRMGIWTYLSRGEGEAALKIDTGRAWHALHVALTGEEHGGASPATWVVWTSPNAVKADLNSAEFVHPPEVVREVAEWLATVDFERAIADLYAAIELGAYVYSFVRWQDGIDMVQSGYLRSVFDRVKQFYAAAALAGQSVAIHRG
jgi:hypothetical protein